MRVTPSVRREWTDYERKNRRAREAYLFGQPPSRPRLWCQNCGSGVWRVLCTLRGTVPKIADPEGEVECACCRQRVTLAPGPPWTEVAHDC